MLFPIMVVVAAVCAFVIWQSLHGRVGKDASTALLNRRIAARFGAFDALDAAIRKYSGSHGGEIPSSVDVAIKFSPELFTPDVMQRDEQVNHNLSQTILLTSIDFTPPNAKEFQYKWAIVLYVPKATMPDGFPATSDFVRWSGEASEPGNWAGGFTSAGEAGQYFGDKVVEAARRQVKGGSTTEPAVATKPQ
jgi:hypothetical protein